MDQGPCRHGGGAADLRLTAAGRAGDAGPVGDHRADAAGGEHGLQHLVLGEVLPPVEGHQHRRHHPAGPGGGGGHDAAHTGVALPHGEGLGNHLSDELPANGGAAGRVVPHLLALAAGEAAEAPPVPGVDLGGLLHGVPGPGHLLQGVAPGHAPVDHIRLQDDLPEGLALPPDGGDNLLHGIQIHLSSPSCSG